MKSQSQEVSFFQYSNSSKSFSLHRVRLSECAYYTKKYHKLQQNSKKYLSLYSLILKLKIKLQNRSINIFLFIVIYKLGHNFNQKILHIKLFGLVNLKLLLIDQSKLFDFIRADLFLFISEDNTLQR